MATIKSYTDLEQSRKLAEILPFESADMCYPFPCKDGDKPLLEQGGFGSTPCWSLAALLDLPESVFTDEYEDTYYLNIEKDGTFWKVWYQKEWDTGKSIEANPTEYLIDACYEMFLKLHELKML